MMRTKRFNRMDWSLYMMMLPALLVTLVYHYGPLGGLVIAFQEYDIARSLFQQRWVGLDNFRYLFIYPGFAGVLWNTIYISVMKIIGNFFMPIAVAILINEITQLHLKRNIQTLIYLPHFMSWVIISGIFIDLLSPSTGIVNKILIQMGADPIYFLGEPKVFPFVLVVTDVWKEFGFGTIIYMAALTSIDPSLYEAADIDGARRFQKIRYITIPGIMPIMVLVGTLSLGRVLNAGFDQVFNMANPLVYSTGEILDTLTYRIGIAGSQYDIATTIGLFRSLISLVLVSGSYFLAHRYANYRIF